MGYTLWWTNSWLLKMAIEIVDFPINSMVIFHCYVSSPEGIHVYSSWMNRNILSHNVTMINRLYNIISISICLSIYLSIHPSQSITFSKHSLPKRKKNNWCITKFRCFKNGWPEVHAPGAAVAAALPLQRPEGRRGPDLCGDGAAEGLAVRGAAGRRGTARRLGEGEQKRLEFWKF